MTNPVNIRSTYNIFKEVYTTAKTSQGNVLLEHRGLLKDLNKRISKQARDPKYYTQGMDKKEAEEIAAKATKKYNEIKNFSKATHFDKPNFNANDVAVGFKNKGANCWANSFLQMVVHVRSLREAVLAVAEKHEITGKSDDRKKAGKRLREAIEAYDKAFAEKKSVDESASQNVRLSMNKLFGLFSRNEGRHEDASEALIAIMGEYQEINPDSPLFSTQTLTWTRLDGTQTAPDTQNGSYHIQLPLEKSDEYANFDLLVRDFFIRNANEEERQDGLQAAETLYNVPPQEFFIGLGRFGADLLRNEDGSYKLDSEGKLTTKRYKINAHVNIGQQITLPGHASALNEPANYELTSFIEHQGSSITGGHYIAYRKGPEGWVKCNDSHVRACSNQEIDKVLQEDTTYIHHYRRIDAPKSSSSYSAAQPEEDHFDYEVPKATTAEPEDNRFHAEFHEFKPEFYDYGEIPTSSSQADVKSTAKAQDAKLVKELKERRDKIALIEKFNGKVKDETVSEKTLIEAFNQLPQPTKDNFKAKAKEVKGDGALKRAIEEKKLRKLLNTKHDGKRTLVERILKEQMEKKEALKKKLNA